MLKIQLALLCMFSQVHFPSFHTEKPSLCLTLVFTLGYAFVIVVHIHVIFV